MLRKGMCFHTCFFFPSVGAFLFEPSSPSLFSSFGASLGLSFFDAFSPSFFPSFGVPFAGSFSDVFFFCSLSVGTVGSWNGSNQELGVMGVRFIIHESTAKEASRNRSSTRLSSENTFRVCLGLAVSRLFNSINKAVTSSETGVTIGLEAAFFSEP